MRNEVNRFSTNVTNTVESGYRGKFGLRKIILYNQVSSIKRVWGKSMFGFLFGKECPSRPILDVNV